METEFFEFVQVVAERGYQVLKTTGRDDEHAPPRAHPAPFLTHGHPVSTNYPRRVYQPLKEAPTLFLTFAALDPAKEESVVAFANQHGLLAEDRIIHLRHPGSPRKKLVGTGEPLSLWRGEVRAMWRVVGLWEMLKSQDLEALSHVIRWRGKDAVSYQEKRPDDPHPRQFELIASRKKHPGLLEWFQPGDVVFPGWYYLVHCINERLSRRASPRLLWTMRERTVPPPPLHIYFVPHNLLGALWLQFALVVEGARDYRRCENCGKPIVVGGWPDTARTNRRTCSPACKTAAWRKRRKEKPLPR